MIVVVKFIGITLGIVGVLLFLVIVFAVGFCFWKPNKAQAFAEKMSDQITGIGSQP